MKPKFLSSAIAGAFLCASMSTAASMDASGAAVKQAKNYINSSGELMLYGIIGDWWEGNDAGTIVSQLEYAKPDGDLHVRIHSEGGNILEGLAIYNALKQSSRRIVVTIDGMALSMATIIALAGDEVRMPRNAYQFLHMAQTSVSGDADELRATADQIEAFSQQAATIYAEHSSLTEDQALEMMANNTWLNAEQCLAHGLIDTILDPVEAIAHCPNMAADMMLPAGVVSLLQLPTVAEIEESAPADEPETPEEEDDVPDPKKAQMNAGGGNNPAPQNPTGAAEAKAAVQAERTRQAELRGIAEMSNRHGQFVTAEMLNEWLDGETTPDQARAAALKAIGEADKANTPSGRGSGQPGVNMQTAISAALAHRCAPGDNPLDGPNEFAHMSLIDMSRRVLDMNGVTTAGMTAREIAGAVMHSTSDLPAVFADVANNELARGYAARPRTFQQFSRQRILADFKPQNITRLSDAPQLLPKAENGEYQLGHLRDSKRSIALETKGRLVKFSREMIINDDLDALSRLPLMMGAQAALNENRVVYSLLTSNPKMEDGKSLFHADHKNQGTGAISVNSIGKLRELLRKQTSFAAKDEEGYALNTPLKGIIVPAALETEAEKLVASITANKAGDVNPFTGLTVISEALLDENSAAAFYGFGDNNLIDTIEYGYLEGEAGAFIDSELEFSSDALVMKVRHDFAAQVADYRGLVKSTGA